MPLMCCTRQSLFKICFGTCMSSEKGIGLANKVGSTNNLDVVEENGPNTHFLYGSTNDLLKNNTPDVENKSYTLNKGEDQDLEAGTNEVIVTQPINTIKIMNVTYQKTLYNTSSVNQRRVSVAVDGHVNNRPASTDSPSIDVSSEGNQDTFSLFYLSPILD